MSQVLLFEKVVLPKSYRLPAVVKKAVSALSPQSGYRYEVADVKALRESLAITQTQLAQALGTSVDTIKSWESKRRNPTCLAAKVLATIQDNPEFYHQLAAH